MSKAMRCIILAWTLIFSLPHTARAQQSPPTQAEEETRAAIEKVRQTVAAERGKLAPEVLDAKLQEILLPLFDFDQMARSSLGANWKNITPQQQQEFVSNFSTLLSQTYLAKIRKNIERSTVTFLPAVPQPNRVLVRTKVEIDGEKISIDYRMYINDGRWRAYDVVIENVGLVSNYRNEFTSVLEKEDFNALLERLKSKTAKLKQQQGAES